jgi:hypothetical protein
MHGLPGSADTDFNFVIAYQKELADAMGFLVESAEFWQQAHGIQRQSRQ